jgi:hypothetical protein
MIAMLTSATAYALIIKMAPYVIAMKVMSGVIDVGVHAVKRKIGKVS